MKEEDPYIKILKYAKEHLKTGVEREESQKFINKVLGLPVLKEGKYQQAVYRINADVFNHQTGSDFGDGKLKYFMDINAYFNLLEYTELKEARTSSAKARTLSQIAIAFAVVALFFNIVFSVRADKRDSITAGIEISQACKAYYSEEEESNAVKPLQTLANSPYLPTK